MAETAMCTLHASRAKWAQHQQSICTQCARCRQSLYIFGCTILDFIFQCHLVCMWVNTDYKSCSSSCSYCIQIHDKQLQNTAFSNTTGFILLCWTYAIESCKITPSKEKLTVGDTDTVNCRPWLPESNCRVNQNCSHSKYPTYVLRKPDIFTRSALVKLQIIF